MFQALDHEAVGPQVGDLGHVFFNESVATDVNDDPGMFHRVGNRDLSPGNSGKIITEEFILNYCDPIIL